MEHFDWIRGWAEQRNLVDGSDPKSQFLKLIEEVGELSRGIGKDNLPEIIDAIGDTIVVLTIIAQQYDLAVEECIDAAWHQIKDRKGKMVNGVFVKEVLTMV